MTYTTLAALVDRYGEVQIVSLSDRNATGGIDQRVVDQAIAGATTTIDASLAVRYRLPLASVPPFVAELALAIAYYRLHVFTAEGKAKDDYEQALKDLREIASGAKKLDVAGLEPAGSGGGGVIATDRERALTPENLSGFI